MNYLGVTYSIGAKPELDPGFIPFGVWMDAYLKDAKKPIAIAIERDRGQVSVRKTFIHGTPDMAKADYRYVERLVKFLLWSIGGFKVYVCGCDHIAKQLQADYSKNGKRAFDYDFFHKLYEVNLEIIDLPLDKCPAPNESTQPLGGHMDGCRIGFDAGGSDRKVSAVIDGECVYSEEVVWFPKLNEDPNYQYNEILTAFRTAASKMPRVDAIVVANDGDVSALAGAMGLNTGNIMGLAMGTSEAVGYVDADKNVLGWITELAFAPVDLAEDAMQDEWSTDFGVGCKYFSQDAVIKLAPRAGIELDPALSPAEKLKVVQALMAEDDPRAAKIYHDIGVYLANAVVLYSHFYDIEHLMLMGRVMSGKGGDIILDVCQKVLAAEHPELAKHCQVMLPDEKTRRVGQSVAAASLPEIRK